MFAGGIAFFLGLAPVTAGGVSGTVAALIVGLVIIRHGQVRASRLRLYPEEFFRLPIIQPPANEQLLIVENIREETAELETRTRLVADVVTGKLDVREAAARLPDRAECSMPDLAPDADAGDEEADEEATTE